MHTIRLSLTVALICAAAGIAGTSDTYGQPPSYTLGPGDEITITVFGEEDLSMTLRLGDTGRLNYPFLGGLQVEGISVSELEQTITQGLLGDYLINPVVTVSVNEYRPFFVSGEVQSPGGIPYQPRLTVERAIALAGGFTERGSRNKIQIIRADDPSDTPRDVELSDTVGPGDIVTVNQSFF